jgi:hypothetical protein
LNNDFIVAHLTGNIIIRLKDENNTINLESKDDGTCILKYSLKGDAEKSLSFIKAKSKLSKNKITFHFESINDVKEYCKITSLDDYTKDIKCKVSGIFECNKKFYQTNSFNRLVYNIIHTFIPETYYRTLRIVMFFENKEVTVLDIKQSEIEEVSFFIGAEIATLKLIDENKWKFNIGLNKYYLVIDKFINIEDPISDDKFSSFSIINNDKKIGYGSINYSNWISQRDSIDRRIKKLYQPLERPLIEVFINKSFGKSSPILDLIGIIFLVCLMVLICIIIIA